MSQRLIRKCDRCGMEPINRHYTLVVRVSEELPQGGGVCTGSELNERFDFCQTCKQSASKELWEVLRRKEPQ